MRSFLLPTVLPLLLQFALSLSAQAALLTPAEADQLGDRVCKPASNGLLDCMLLDAPVAPGNDASIVPLPQYEFSGEQFPPPFTDQPNRPTLDPLPPRLPGRSVTIAWDIGYGTAAQYWEIWDNGQLRVRSRQFSQRSLLKNQAEGSEPLAGIDTISVQSGSHTLDGLAEGRHEFDVRLCNTDRNSKPVCTVVTASTWVGEDADGASGAASADGEASFEGLPSPPEIAWFPQINTGEPFELAWNIWWGKPGSYWQVLLDGKLMHESRSFRESTPHSQSAAMAISGLLPGVHKLTVRLCNQLLCTESQPANLEVLLPPEQGVRPQVSLERGTPDSMILSWSIPQARVKAMPERWRLLDGEGGREIVEPAALGRWQTGIRNCQVNERQAPAISTVSYCSETRLPVGGLPESLVVEVCRGEECLQSTPRALASRAPDKPE
ncbi:chitinase N-terminal domain-containing protein [Chitinilyticum litopenaei]|uniref:chitinase N-terminal domain-containing protein n=1 Tax=Chitinilyticum litopenaei TaxID=1121276 RepID=UPI0004275B2C|nr:chitinase N-terminal domain-containing protein [Chitinilyticum litopenaei]